MMRSWTPALLAAALTAAPAAALAASLQVTPVNIEVPAPGAASKITLSNPGTDNVTAQIRVFRWLQAEGEDRLVATRDVVASPPAVKLAPGKKAVIRIVRLGKTPAAAEETYRLVVDEVPKPPKPGQAGVGFTVRHSIPVFFSKPGADGELTWKAKVTGGKLVLQADNAGGRRVRVASLKVVDGAGATIRFGEGLAGYVLGQSSKFWVMKGAAKSLKPGASITIIAQGDNGPIEATARVVAAN
jgi:fimbrial chaperone protein